MPADLDDERWVGDTARRVAQAQTDAVRATSGYLSAFATLELGTRQVVRADAADYAGRARDGRPLEEALRSPVIGTKAALKLGEPVDAAVRAGFARARTAVGMDIDQAARHALSDAIARDDRFSGWQRALAGTCGACAARARGPESGTRFQVHPGCRCVQEPTVRGVSNTYLRPTGQQFFAALDAAKQDEMLGPDKAALVRTGEVSLADLVDESDMETEPNWITETPLAALG